MRWETDFGVAELSQLNLYDRTVEGLVLRDVAGATVQYHPEAGPGPHDARHLFDRFLALAGDPVGADRVPRRDDIQKILLIGSGPIVIGQAAEFDYSGVQACKVLLEEGYEVVLVNSNPATIMTDPEFATATYIEPLLPGPVTKIIEKERPDALLPTLGGQTALNLAMSLHEDGTLETLRGRADRRRRRRDPPRRGPRGVPHDDERGRDPHPLVDHGRDPGRGRGGARRRPHHPAGDRPARLHDGRPGRRDRPRPRPSCARSSARAWRRARSTRSWSRSR